MGEESTRFRSESSGGFLEAETSSVVSTFQLYAGLGTLVRLPHDFTGLLELRWTQSGAGTRDELSPQPLPAFVDGFVARPDLNHTSWGFSLGIMGPLSFTK